LYRETFLKKIQKKWIISGNKYKMMVKTVVCFLLVSWRDELLCFECLSSALYGIAHPKWQNMANLGTDQLDEIKVMIIIK
jgi:hypothetical protein